ncbi:hypothetical protein [Streptomyces sp. GC420]|uniref:hypothetical protein n=1 Tax=Streptomyces sp. GC420 TaxID=2697568 RepID=UPI001414D456|nr:hypothetical protein [Streptomyces sp. GC420]NBM18707.1 hypothetical protein [Streptomyces sp. GC420]
MTHRAHQTARHLAGRGHDPLDVAPAVTGAGTSALSGAHAERATAAALGSLAAAARMGR